MKVRIFLLVIGWMLSILSSSLYAQSDNIVTHSKSVSGFSVLQLKGGATILFTQSDDYSLKIEGPEKYVKRVQVKVKEDKLMIRNRNHNNNRNKLKFYISAPDLSLVKMDGVYFFESEQELKLKDLEFNVKGVNTVKLADLNCHKLQLLLKGVNNGDIHVNCYDLDMSAKGVINFSLSGSTQRRSVRGSGLTARIDTSGLKVGE